MITYQKDGVKMPLIKKRENNAWIKAVAACYGKKVGDIAYIFCSDERILEVNKEYLQHNYYTDIITFDYSEGDVISGDVFVSLDTVRSNAEQFGQAYEQELHAYAIEKLSKLDNNEVYNPTADGCIITFNVKNVFAQDAASYFNTQGIAVRAGQHCAKLLLEKLGTSATLRASCTFYNTKEEIDRFVEVCKNATIENCLDVFF